MADNFHEWCGQMSDPIPRKSMTPEEAAVLLSAPVMEVVPIPDGFGLAIDVVSDDDETSVERQYFTFDNLDVANTFRALVKGEFN